MDLDDIQKLTVEYGEGWADPHVQRVLHLISLIDQGLSYDPQALAYAVYLHDWGAFPRYRQPGVDHALRSRQVAEAEILPQTELSPAECGLVLHAIERHDYRDPRPAETTEALLLREADFLDFLGAIGVAREFAWGPNDLKICCERILSRKETLQERFTLPAAQAIAARRLAEMAHFLKLLEEESFGHL